MAGTDPLTLARFWSKADVRGARQCWLWRAGTTDHGYGRFRDTRAHRYAYRHAKGEIPEDLMIRHLCGNKLCVNPRHLETGTMLDNARDGIRLGEILRGSRNGRSKLTEQAALEIIENREGLKNAELARRYGVSPATITLVQNGKRWGHLSSPPLSESGL